MRSLLRWLFAEAAAYYKTKNMTLWDAMLAMYERYGYYKDGVKAVTMKGIEGLEKIQEIMNELRTIHQKSSVDTR